MRVVTSNCAAGIKDGEEALGHHVVNLALDVVEFVGRFERGDDGEVIGNLRVVEDALGRLDPAFVQNLRRERAERAVLHVLQRLADRVDVILRQRARIGSRIGQHLVMLVEPLRDLQRALGGEAEPAVGLALQRGQVVKERRKLRGRLLFLGDDAGLAVALGDERLGFRRGPEPLGLRVRIVLVAGEILLEPAAGIRARLGAEGGVHFPVALRHESLNFLVALDHDGQRRRLHAARPA